MKTIKGRLLTCVAFLVASVGIVAGIGHYATSVASNGLETVFHDRVRPLRELKALSDLYSVNIVDTAHKVRNGSLEWARASFLVSSATSSIARRWRDYEGSDMPEAERVLANEVKGLMGKANAAIEEFFDVLVAEDRASLEIFVLNKLYPAIDPLSEGINKLTAFQIDEAESQFEIADQSVTRAGFGMIAALVLAAAAGAFALWTTIFGVARPVAAITDCMRRLSKGERGLSIPYSGRADEIGSMAEALQVFRDNAEETLRLREEQKAAQEQASAERRAARQRLAEEFQSAVGGIIESVSNASSQLVSAANLLSSTADSTQERSGAVAAASEET